MPQLLAKWIHYPQYFADVFVMTKVWYELPRALKGLNE